MVKLMQDANGVGLAANQVGIIRRVFVFQPDPDSEPVAIVNPVIVEPGGETVRDEEGCLSMQGVQVPVERPLTVRLEGRDPEGGEISMDLGELGARVAQHELDHLDGVLILDGRTTRRAARLWESFAHAPSSPRSAVNLGVAATAPFGADVLRRLAERHDIAYLLTRPDRRQGRGRQLAAPPAKQVANELGIEVRQPERPADLDDLGVDVVVAVAYGALIPEELLDQALWLQ